MPTPHLFIEVESMTAIRPRTEIDKFSFLRPVSHFLVVEAGSHREVGAHCCCRAIGLHLSTEFSFFFLLFFFPLLLSCDSTLPVGQHDLPGQGIICLSLFLSTATLPPETSYYSPESFGASSPLTKVSLRLISATAK